jgi:hypothetical protein
VKSVAYKYYVCSVAYLVPVSIQYRHQQLADCPVRESIDVKSLAKFKCQGSK